MTYPPPKISSHKPGYVLVCAVLSLIAASRLGDYTNKDISREYDDVRAMGDRR
ncbi:hypothetical protein GNZ12_19010 [Paraburkholderia sp. 1N]|uniref:Uncharacterized protein n=1 Tax=Paraburkholderia solitsugae TaxID=2675748 RepID=A0ABX2BR34_9BURK|nr:hypothetical protein [Paraburkholderia solitsugae]NPT43359.1 hypothetical protein [Paraburkholderia solitsugae]